MYPDMEKELYEWIIDQRSSGYIVTSLHIRLQAQKFCKDPNFKAKWMDTKVYEKAWTCNTPENKDSTEAA